MTDLPTIKLQKINENMREFLRSRALLDAQLPAILAVSKTYTAEAIIPFLQAGHLLFGENRVQEAAVKWPPLKKEYPHCKLHLIGALQTNKTDEAVTLFDVIESLDRPKLADALAKSMKKAHRRLPCYIQVNTGEEPQKSGIAPQQLEEFYHYSTETCGLTITGLMCIPPADENPAPHFALLTTLARRLNLPDISMGMSSDYALAASLGSTQVRIGSALFGERVPVEPSAAPGQS